MELFENFLKITLLPLGAVLVCGFIVWSCKCVFMKLLGRQGYRAVMLSSVIGTPIHELGHAAMCLPFGHKIVKMVLWQPRSGDGTLGYVRHTYDPDNLYHRLGCLFISTGPIFSGVAVLSLLLFLSFPETWSSYISSVRPLVEQNAPIQEILFRGLGMIPGLAREFGGASAPLWMQILSVVMMLSVSLHITLSPQDLRSSLVALPSYLMITLLVTLLTTLLGSGATGLVLSALRTFHVFMMAMLSVVLAFAAVQAVLALAIHLLLRFLRK